MFTKMALPLLGGAPNVWNTAMVFFQAVLLAGYLYAHFVTTRLSPRKQLAVHLLVVLLGVIALPISIAFSSAPASGFPALWLIGLFGASLGLPFFALSANAPLLQRWFSYTGHQDAHDPYFLYSASNIGSLLSLCAYPFIIEPAIGLKDQSQYWAFGYFALIACIAGTGWWTLARGAITKTPVAEKVETPPVEIGIKRKAEWVAIAAIPSALMLGVTSHLSENVAAAPFLWVGPLAAYLLTFVVAFAKKPVIRHKVTTILFPFAAVFSIIGYYLGYGGFFATIIFSLLFFFLIALYCHGRLAELRPPVSNLTEFYVAMSLGGVLGGAFTALAAPLLFNDVYEFPLLIILSALVGVAFTSLKDDLVKIIIAFGVALLPVLLITQLLQLSSIDKQIAAWIVAIAFLAALAAVFLKFRVGLNFFGALAGLTGAALLVDTFTLEGHSGETIYQDRSFFGVVKVSEYESGLGKYKVFIHGNTVHNVQLDTDEHRREPLAYFGRPGPFGQAIAAIRGATDQPLDVGLIGLGAGAMACYAESGDNWTIFEIDPVVLDVAKHSGAFTYVNDCLPNAPIEIGDARLLIDGKAPQSYDLIIVDAFSSDSIPAHLVTKEAVALFTEKLKPNGLIFFHTSNRLLDVSSVAAAGALESGLTVKAIDFEPESNEGLDELRFHSTAVIAGERSDIERVFANYPDWRDFEPNEHVEAWTDDYSHILGAIRAKSAGGGQYATD